MPSLRRSIVVRSATMSSGPSNASLACPAFTAACTPFARATTFAFGITDFGAPRTVRRSLGRQSPLVRSIELIEPRRRPGHAGANAAAHACSPAAAQIAVPDRVMRRAHRCAVVRCRRAKRPHDDGGGPCRRHRRGTKDEGSGGRYAENDSPHNVLRCSGKQPSYFRRPAIKKSSARSPNRPRSPSRASQPECCNCATIAPRVEASARRATRPTRQYLDG